ncbi:MAG: TraB/GumN family protein [Tissierellia bacterium]|nr:TraB/GumN family protein [Tissierellia bacterium]
MTRNRRIVFLLAILLIIPFPIFGEDLQQGAICNPWAREELTDGDKMGIYPIDYLITNMDFTLPIQEKEINDIYERTLKKLKELDLERTSPNVYHFKKGTRGEILDSLYTLYCDFYNDGKNTKDPVAFFQEKNILKGNGSSLNLEGICSREEAIALYVRTLKALYHDLGCSAKGFFWSIEHNGNIVYLLGSIHVGKHKMYPIRKEVMDAFHHSTHVYFEIDSNEQEELEYMKKQMIYTDGRTLKDDLGEKDYNTFREIMTVHGIPESIYQYYRPWAAYSLISSNPQNISLQSYLGVETYFTQKAKLHKKKIGQLESIKSQTDVLYNFDSENYLFMIKNLLQEINQHGYRTLDDQMNSLQDVWIEGDVRTLNQYLKAEEKSGPHKSFNETLLGNRDIHMANEIEKLLKSKEKHRSFVIIGAAHLTPKNSVLGMLKQKGYTIKAYQ